VSTWGVLRLSAPGAARLAQHRRTLSAFLDGLVAVPAPVRVHAPVRAPGLRAHGFEGTLGALVAGLSSVPRGVERIAFLDERVLDSLGVEPVIDMISWLDEDHAAVVRAVPVTDALKRVEDGTVMGGVERAGLFLPQPPHIIRREALDSALGGATVPASADPAGLLVAAGHAVRVVRDAGPPFTLTAAR
jgi:hypothetical protein